MNIETHQSRQTFKPGTRVICVYDRNSRLERGQAYIVAKPEEPTALVAVEGLAPLLFHPSRFLSL